MIMWLYGLEPLNLSHRAANLGGFRHCDKGDEMFLICHLISKDLVFKGLYDFMGGSPS